MLHISVTSKLDGIRSWSLLARETCPGSIDPTTGGLVSACRGCYAVGGNYRFPNVRTVRMANRKDWLREQWVTDMIAALRNDRYFRWFDSGDIYDVRLGGKILQVMRATPWCQHWVSTRMHKFPKIASVLDQMDELANVKVRRSSDSITGEYDAKVHGSTIVPSADEVPAGARLCASVFNEGKCGACRACFDKSVAVIAYVAHGRIMSTVLRKELRERNQLLEAA